MAITPAAMQQLLAQSSTYQVDPNVEQLTPPRSQSRALLDETAKRILEHAKLSAIKIFKKRRVPDLRHTGDPQYVRSSGSGFAFEHKGKKYIMTNAHVAAGKGLIQVKRQGTNQEVDAELVFCDPTCDLAIIRVVDADNNDNAAFWQKVLPSKLASNSSEQAHKLYATGYPMGGNALSITEGTVSRLESRQYAYSGVSIPCANISAPINPGNSGCPVYNNNGEVVGVAHQGINGASALGYMIPLDVIKHLLDAFDKNLPYACPGLELDTIVLLNKATRDVLQCDKIPDEVAALGKVDKEKIGIMVQNVASISAAHGYLQADDVLFAIDGHPLHRTHQVLLDSIYQEYSLEAYLAMKQPGSDVTFAILRAGEIKQVTFSLKHRPNESALVQNLDEPRFYLAAGMIFQVLDLNIISIMPEIVIHPKVNCWLQKAKNSAQEECVMLVHIFDTDEGHDNYGQPRLAGPTRVKAINGKPIICLEDVMSAIETRAGAHHHIELYDEHLTHLYAVNNKFRPAAKKLFDEGRVECTNLPGSKIQAELDKLKAFLAQYAEESSSRSSANCGSNGSLVGSPHTDQPEDHIVEQQPAAQSGKPRADAAASFTPMLNMINLVGRRWLTLLPETHQPTLTLSQSGSKVALS